MQERIFGLNEAVDHFTLLDPHFQGAIERAQELGRVLVVHDTTEFSFAIHNEPARENLPVLSANRQGFYWPASLSVTADGTRVPMGLVASRPYVHVSQIQDQETRTMWEEIEGIYDNEKWRWVEAIESSQGAP